MPANECIAIFEPGARITGYTTAAVVGKTFAAVSAATGDGLIGGDDNVRVATAAARGAAIGVFAYDAARNTTVAVLNGPGMVVPITTGGAVVAGDQISADASGRAVRFSTSGAVLGIAMDSADSGADCPVRLYT